MSILLEKLKLKYKDSTFYTAAALPETIRTRTGVMPFDICLGGGLCIGRGYELYGRRSSGKSTLSAIIAGTFQKTCTRCWRRFCTCSKKPQYGEVVYINTEDALDPLWLRALGVDAEALIVHEPDTAEEAINVGRDVLEEPSVALLIVDTIISMPIANEVKAGKSAGDSTDRQIPKMLTKLTRLWGHSVKRSRKQGGNPTVLVINQARAGETSMGGTPMIQPPGGHALEHFCGVMVEFRVAKMEYESDVVMDPSKATKSTKTAFNTSHKEMTTAFTIRRNKTSPYIASGRYTIASRTIAGVQHAGQVLDHEYLLDTAAAFRYLEKTAKGWRCGAHEFQTKEQIFALWDKSPEMFEEDACAVLDEVRVQKLGLPRCYTKEIKRATK